jgi:hypothetical protein
LAVALKVFVVPAATDDAAGVITTLTTEAWFTVKLVVYGEDAYVPVIVHVPVLAEV